MAIQKQATRRRLARLAYECGFEAFTKPSEALAVRGTEGILGLAKLLDEVPDEELGEIEATLKDFRGLQEGLRSLN